MTPFTSSTGSAHASSSLRPHATTPASYHPLPRPRPLPPLEPVDTKAIKQELHDALGENGLPYWKAMNGYILGQVGRGELEVLVREWLPGDKIHLHNKLLVSLLHNASTFPAQPVVKKRKRVSPDHPEYDTDETSIEARHRVAYWLSSLTPRDRARLKRLMAAPRPQDGGGAGSGAGEDDDDEAWLVKRRLQSSYTPVNPLAPVVADRHLPSVHQLSQRLSGIASTYGLSLAPDTASELGEFMSVGADAHLADILHGIVHLTGRERAAQSSIQIPIGHGHGHANGFGANGEAGDEDTYAYEDHASYHATTTSDSLSPSLPRPTVETLQTIFTIRPDLHPQASPALYKLGTAHQASEASLRRERQRLHPSEWGEDVVRLGGSGVPRASASRSKEALLNGHALAGDGPSAGAGAGVGSNGDGGGVTGTGAVMSNGLGTGIGIGTLPSSLPALPAAATTRLNANLNGPHRQEIMSRSLIENGLVKFDKTDEAGKKKHTFHWKYEDPALLLRDILG